jgi:serine/threonine protein kinase
MSNRNNKGKGKRTHSKVGSGPNEHFSGRSPHMNIPHRNSVGRRQNQPNTLQHVQKQHRWAPSTSSSNAAGNGNMATMLRADPHASRSFAQVVAAGGGSGSGGSGSSGSLKIQTSPMRKKKDAETRRGSGSGAAAGVAGAAAAAVAGIGAVAAMHPVTTASPPVPMFNASRPKTTPIAVSGAMGSAIGGGGSTSLLSLGGGGGGARSARAGGNKRVGLKDFERIRVLGKGAFGKVILAREKKTGEVYAMKILKKTHVVNKRQVEHTMSERYVLGRTKHPFIVGMHYAFQTNEKLIFVLDYCAGGDLYYHISRAGHLPLDRARFYTAELVEALAHLHSRGVVYRDLKPENVMMDMDGHVKLVDFGLSKQGITNPVSGAHSYCGTPEYLAPEVMTEQAFRSYGTAIDWWSLGALLYEMLTGLPPWYNRDRKKMFAGIRAGELRFPETVPPDAQSLLRALLCRNPRQRLGATQDGVDQIRQHEFFKDIDWKALVKRQIPAPWKPQAETSQDAEKMSLIYFDKVFTRLPINSEGGGSHLTSSPAIGGTSSSPGFGPGGSSTSPAMAIGSVGVGSMGGDQGRGQFQGFSYMPTSQLEVSF